jgi:hypothetical protein
MLEILFYAAVIWLCVMIARAVSLHTNMAQQRDRVMQELDQRVRIVDLENIPGQNCILAYDKENQEFLGQGADIEHVKQVIMQRFPSKVFVLGDKVFSGIPQANVVVKI